MCYLEYKRAYHWRINKYMQLFSVHALISDHSYRRGGGMELISDAVRHGQIVRNNNIR